MHSVPMLGKTADSGSRSSIYERTALRLEIRNGIKKIRSGKEINNTTHTNYFKMTNHNLI
jgi:hypothetical protein